MQLYLRKIINGKKKITELAQFAYKKNEVVIFENLNFKNWTQIIHSSNLVITPECGLIHVAAACKIPSKIIYNANNKPNMMYKEYTPLKSKHERFLFNDKNLNSLLTQNL